LRRIDQSSFLKARVDVICDKPLSVSLAEGNVHSRSAMSA
jgi:predicted dehydrogenase